MIRINWLSLTVAASSAAVISLYDWRLVIAYLVGWGMSDLMDNFK